MAIHPGFLWKVKSTGVATFYFLYNIVMFFNRYIHTTFFPGEIRVCRGTETGKIFIYIHFFLHVK